MGDMTRLNGKRNNLLVPITIVVLVIAAIALAVWQRNRTNAVSASATTIDFTGQPTLGPADAKVKVAVFEDFKCPNCQRYDQQVFPQIRQNYIDTGKIHYAFFNFPFIGPDSTTAALAGECVYDQRPALFWPYADIVYRAQKSEETTWATPAYLTELGGLVEGVDTGKLRGCIDSGTTKAAVDKDQALVQQLGVNATPTVFVNGVKIAAYDYNSVSAAIDAALK